MSNKSSVVLLALIFGVAAVTNPTTASLRRLIDRAVNKDSGGGVVGFLAGKIAKGAVLLAMENDGYRLLNCIFATLVIPTKELRDTDGADWMFLGAFNSWLTLNMKTFECRLLRDAE